MSFLSKRVGVNVVRSAFRINQAAALQGKSSDVSRSLHNFPSSSQTNRAVLTATNTVMKTPSRTFIMDDTPKQFIQYRKAEVEEKLMKAIKSFDRFPHEKEKTSRGFHTSQICLGDGWPVSMQAIEERIILVLSLYDKINAEKLTLDTHLINDLGLDSLDHVEVIMAIEDEFDFEIPDADAERLMTPKDLHQYICDRLDVYE